MERKGKRTEPSNGPAAPVNTTASLLDDNLEKVRDILFGHQVRALETRIIELEARLLESSNSLQVDLKASVKDLEGKLSSETSRLVDRARDEQAERERADAKLEERFESSEAMLRGQQDHLEEQLQKAQKSLEKRIAEEVKALNEAIRQAQSEANQALEALAAELRDQKTDRHALAAMFRDVAGRLEGQDG